MYEGTAVLRRVVRTQDAYMNDVEAVHYDRTVYVKPRSVRFSEFYEAAKSGLKPEIVLVLSNPMDYQNERIVIYEDREFSVLRAYMKPGRDALELTLAARVENGE